MFLVYLQAIQTPLANISIALYEHMFYYIFAYDSTTQATGGRLYWNAQFYIVIAIAFMPL